VDGDPEDRSAFQGERGADGEEVFHPPGGFVTSVREKPVIAHSNAEASSDPPQQHGDKERFPMEHEQRGDSAEMKGDHHEDRQPNDGLSEGSIMYEYPRQLHASFDYPEDGCARRLGNSCVMDVGRGFL
jgi:hypothetical protein